MTGKTIVTFSIILAAVSLSIGYLLAGFTWGILLVLMLTIFWFVGEWRGWRWAAGLSLLLFVILTVIGLLLDVPPIAGIVPAVAALVGWDFSQFNHYLAQVERVEKRATIEKQHRQRMLIVAVIGLLVAAMAATIRLNFGFGLALLLGFIAILGFSRALSFLRRESD